jgi:hypothetical protein
MRYGSPARSATAAPGSRSRAAPRARRSCSRAIAGPMPRLAEGQALGPVVHAMMDVSDGLLIDARRMAAASGLAVTIDLAAVPLSDAYRAFAGDDRDARLAAARRGTITSCSSPPRPASPCPCPPPGSAASRRIGTGADRRRRAGRTARAARIRARLNPSRRACARLAFLYLPDREQTGGKPASSRKPRKFQGKDFTR